MESCGGLSWEDFLEKPDDLSDFEPDTRALVRVVPDVNDVLVSPSSVVTEFCDGFFRVAPVVKMLEPQSFSFSQTRAHCCTVTQEEMRYESSQVIAHPLSRRRMRPPTPLQNSNDTFEEEQGFLGAEDQMWSACESGS